MRAFVWVHKKRQLPVPEDIIALFSSNEDSIPVKN